MTRSIVMVVVVALGLVACGDSSPGRAKPAAAPRPGAVASPTHAAPIADPAGVDARAVAVLAGGVAGHGAGHAAGDRAQRFADLDAFAAGLAAARRDLATAARGSSAAEASTARVAQLHAALTRTRLALLEDWTGVVRATVTLSPDEARALTAIANDQAKAIAYAGSPGGDRPSSRLRALLGPERSKRYDARHKAFFPAGSRSELVMP